MPIISQWNWKKKDEKKQEIKDKAEIGKSGEF